MTRFAAIQAVLRRDHAACKSSGLATLKEPALTCFTIEKPIADLKLAREERWLAYRGPMPERFVDTAAFAAYSKAWHDKRDAFEITEAGCTEDVMSTEMEARWSRACAGRPVKGSGGDVP